MRRFLRLMGAWQGTTPVVVAVVGALVVLSGVWFANSEGLRLTADQAVVGIRAEAAMSAAAAARNESAQALLVSSVTGEGESDTQVASLELAEAATSRFVGRSTALRSLVVDRGMDIESAEVEYTAALEHLVDRLRVAPSTSGSELFTAELEPAYQDYISVVAEVRDDALEVAQIERSSAGQVAAAARLVVAVVVPLVLVLGFRIGSRRRQRSRELELALGHERSLNTVKDEAIANLSHELRTPLTSIQGFTLAMLDNDILHDPEAAREMVEIVAQESADLGRMIEDLLVAARSEAGALDVQVVPTDVAFEVDAVLEPMRATGLRVGLDVEDAKVLADHLRLRQVLRNLVSNAVKHGGPDIQVRGRRDGERYVIDVSDDGVGIPEHVADRLFQRFVHEGETPLVTGSVGLGLSITKELVELMGGRVGHRRDDRTHFLVSLPLAR